MHTARGLTKPADTLVWGVAARVVALDFISKGLVRAGVVKAPIRINKGLAFSIEASFLVSAIATVGALAILLYFFKRHRASLSTPQLTGFGLIFGGSAANLLERVYSGFVTDFIKIHTGYANIADLGIYTGILILLISLFLRGEKEAA